MSAPLPSTPAPTVSAHGGFPQRIPPAWRGEYDRGTLHPALIRQIEWNALEERSVPGFLMDPVGDHQAHLGDGLLQKYRGRALWLLTGVCAGHCRYCFRRHFPYEDAPGMEERTVRNLRRIAEDPSLSEIILSGGDPLMAPVPLLERMAQALDAVSHVHTLRIHSRVPVFQPGKCDENLVAILGRFQKPKVLVTHVNHPAEWREAQSQVARRFRDAGWTLLNQSVLLREVNDGVETLTDLSRTLWKDGVLPYYLHHLDPVQGSAHFAVPEAEALTLVRDLRHRLPGYLVPRLVWEEAGAPSKQPLPKGSC